VKAQYFEWLARKACVRCGAHPVEIAHVRAFRSPKTDDLLPRRHGIAQVAVLPLCAECHSGETAFERNLGRGSGYLAQKAGSLIAEYFLT